MEAPRTSWLIVNARSGSNSEAALAALDESFARVGIAIARRVCFPDDALPTPGVLDDAGVDTVFIFTGDGTLNAAITALYGWGGQIGVLPGGTKNLLSIRLHDDVTADEILTRIAEGAGVRVRPNMARCDRGDALAGLLAGPGTAWVDVREAMRDLDIAGLARNAGAAISETTGGAMVRLAQPARGRSEGYPMIEITPSHRGMQVDAFYAEGAGEVLQQSWALLKRNFREGPHTMLGLFDRFELENVEGKALCVLIDGEPAELPPRAEFTVVPCEVDLLATWHGY